MAKENTDGKGNFPNPYRPNFWGMVRDILLASLEKGQFLVAILGLVLIILLFKSSPIDGQKTIDGIGAVFKSWAAVGWVLFFVSILLFYFLIRYLRKSHLKEISDLKARCSKLEKSIHAAKKPEPKRK